MPITTERPRSMTTAMRTPVQEKTEKSLFDSLNSTRQNWKRVIAFGREGHTPLRVMAESIIGGISVQEWSYQESPRIELFILTNSSRDTHAVMRKLNEDGCTGVSTDGLQHIRIEPEFVVGNSEETHRNVEETAEKIQNLIIALAEHHSSRSRSSQN